MIFVLMFIVVACIVVTILEVRPPWLKYIVLFILLSAYAYLTIQGGAKYG